MNRTNHLLIALAAIVVSATPTRAAQTSEDIQLEMVTERDSNSFYDETGTLMNDNTFQVWTSDVVYYSNNTLTRNEVRQVSGWPVICLSDFNMYLAQGIIPNWVRSDNVYYTHFSDVKFVTVSVCVIPTPPPCDAPRITAQPQGVRANIGDDAQFSVTATGTDLTFQWYHAGQALAGITSSTLNVTDIQPGDAGDYTVTVCNDCGTVTSRAAKLIILPPPCTAPRITGQPQSVRANPGDDTQFTVTATGTDLSFQWYHDGSLIPGITSSTLDVTQIQTSDAGNYTVKVFNDCGSVTSKAAKLTVYVPPPAPPCITRQPMATCALVGDDAEFDVEATGMNLCYTWYYRGRVIPGENGPTLIVPQVMPTDAGSYKVVVSNAGGKVTSKMAMLKVIKPIVITNPPRSSKSRPGCCVTLRVTASGTGPYCYQWYRDDCPLPHGNRSYYVINGVREGVNTGTYYVVVSNCGNCCPSQAQSQDAIVESY